MQLTENNYGRHRLPMACESPLDCVPASLWRSRAPGWWRNGQYIYATGRRGTNTHENAFVMNADGTDAMSLTDDFPPNSAEAAVR